MRFGKLATKNRKSLRKIVFAERVTFFGWDPSNANFKSIRQLACSDPEISSGYVIA
jgi:hypothetical protein